MRSKNFFYGITCLILALFLILSACGDKKKSNPVSYVDGYQPNYIDEKGTTYTGNFFPIAEGKEWNYEGSMTGYVKATYKGTYMGQPINESEEDSLNYDHCVAISRILAQIMVNLSGKLYTLLPEEQYVDFGMDAAYPEIVRYYEVTDSIVYIRAIPGETNLVEVEDPVFVKSILIVGDSWASNPTINVSEVISEEGDEITMDAKCKMFVVGMDTLIGFSGPIQSLMPAVQLDEVAEFTGTLKSPDLGDTSLKMSGKILVHFYLAEDIGIVSLDEHLELYVNGTVSDSNGSVAITLTMLMDDELNISSYSRSTLMAHPFDYPKERLFKGKIPFDFNNIIKSATKIINVVKPIN